MRATSGCSCKLDFPAEELCKGLAAHDSRKCPQTFTIQTTKHMVHCIRSGAMAIHMHPMDSTTTMTTP